MRRGEQSNTEIHQLCQLGLALPAVSAELIDAIARRAESRFVVLLVPDADGQPARAFASCLAAEDEFAESLAALSSWDECKSVFSELLKLEHCLAVHLGADSRLGVLLIGRPSGSKPYSDAERRSLQDMEAVLVGLLDSANDVPVDVELREAETGMVILNAEGRCDHLCPGARSLRQAVLYPNGFDAARQDAFWLAGLRDLSRRALIEHDGELTAQAPVWCFDNPRGRFELRAYPLTATGAEPARIAVYIRRLRPVCVHLVLALSVFQLTPRQRDIALLLARGLQVAEAAAQLGLAQATVAGVVKDIYCRLNVNSRQAFRETLLAVDTVQRGVAASQLVLA